MNKNLQQCVDVVVAASKDAISEEQARTLVQRMMDEAERAGRSDLNNIEQVLKDLGKDITQKDKLLTVIQRRNAFLTVIAQRRMRDYVEKFATPGEGLRAFMNGSSKKVTEGRNSVYAQEMGTQNKYVGRLVDELEKNGLTRDYRTGSLDKQVFQEMWQLNRKVGQPGISGSPRAEKIAEIINSIGLEMIQRENRAGAYVRPLEGYVIRQSHDSDAVRLAGGRGWGPGSKEASFRAWSSFILPLLDGEKTFGLKDPQEVLRQAHEGLITGLHDKPQTADIDVNSEIKGTGAMARKVSAQRIFHFKDADSAYAYNQKFGVKSLKEAVIRQIQVRSRSIAMMENFGPNPQMTFDRMVMNLKRDARKASDDVRAMRSLDDWRVEASFRELMGMNEVPSNPSLARMAASVRALTNMAKLGASTITSIADKAFMHSEMTFQGIKSLDSFTSNILAVTKGRPEGETRSMLNLMGAATDGFIGSVVRRFSQHDAKAGTLFKLQQKFFTLNGMNWWNDVHKGAASQLMAAHLAEHAHLASEDLPKEIKNVLDLYGINGNVWDFIRQHGLHEVDGRNYITPDALDSVDAIPIDKILKTRNMKPTDNNRQRLRDEIDTKLRAYFSDRVNIAVPTPGNEERVYQHWNTRAGTPLGEAVRMVMLFKSMPITAFKKIVQREIYGRGSNTVLDWLKNDRTGNFRLLQIVAATTVAGYMSGAIKDMIRGRTPKNPEKPRTILDAMQRGGGLGIYGDFLFNEYDRSYKSFLNVAAGPVVGQLDSIADIADRARQGDEKQAARGAGKLLLDNAPFINLFYIRPVLDYLVLWNLQEMSNPGSLRRMEQNADKNYGQGFFVSPSQTVNK